MKTTVVPEQELAVKELKMAKDTQQDTQPEPILTEESTLLQESFFGMPTVIAEPVDPLETPFPPFIRTHPLTD